MTYGEMYTRSTLVRVVCDDKRPFVAGLLVDGTTDEAKCVFAAPILAWCVGQRCGKLRQSFKRLGWRATIVRRTTGVDT